MGASSRVLKAAPFAIVAVIAVALFTVANSFDYRPSPGRPGPDLWPKILLALMFLAALWGGLSALLFNSGDEDGGDPTVAGAAAAPAAEGERSEHWWRTALSIVLLLGYVAGISYVGFYVASACLMFGIMLLAGFQRFLLAGALSLTGALAFFFIFQRVAYISLPIGVGPFKTFSTALMSLIGVR